MKLSRASVGAAAGLVSLLAGLVVLFLVGRFGPARSLRFAPEELQAAQWVVRDHAWQSVTLCLEAAAEALSVDGRRIVAARWENPRIVPSSSPVAAHNEIDPADRGREDVKQQLEALGYVD